MRGKSLGEEQFAQNSSNNSPCVKTRSRRIYKIHGAKQCELKGFLAAATMLWICLKKSSEAQLNPAMS